MPATTVLDADQLARQRFKERVSEELPPGVPEPETDEVDPTALDVAVRAVANRALGPEPTPSSLGMDGRASDADKALREAKASHREKARELADRWQGWIQEVGEIPEENRVADAIPEPPGDPSEILQGAAVYYRQQQRSSDPPKFTTAAAVIAWRLAIAALITD